MLALTIKQPWASAVVLGLKRKEYRSWYTPHRGLLLIHAGKTIDEKGVREYPDVSGPAGAIIGTVKVIDVVRFNPGWAWILEDPRPIDPVYCSGQTTLWTLGDVILRQLRKSVTV